MACRCELIGSAVTLGLFSHAEREPVNPDKPSPHRGLHISPHYSGGAGHQLLCPTD